MFDAGEHTQVLALIGNTVDYCSETATCDFIASEVFRDEKIPAFEAF